MDVDVLPFKMFFSLAPFTRCARRGCCEPCSPLHDSHPSLNCESTLVESLRMSFPPCLPSLSPILPFLPFLHLPPLCLPFDPTLPTRHCSTALGLLLREQFTHRMQMAQVRANVHQLLSTVCALRALHAWPPPFACYGESRRAGGACHPRGPGPSAAK